ncbi:MAG TPA: tRNA lysidine(34) synthetase TilS [Planctomycetota bacterium]|nr:tRNA lysidine(34) synthetase TilS [Planctomycetota bacterium]
MQENSLFDELGARGAESGAGDPSDSPAQVLPAWAERWERLARLSQITPGEPLLVALSGGADSVLLLYLARHARPAHPLRAVHVDHGLRGEESRADARFCEALCAELGVDFAVRSLDLDGRRQGLEARARAARYGVLVEEASRFQNATIVTAHHADDALETLLLRWTRGTRAGGLAALAARRSFQAAPKVSVVRPLISLRKDELRAWLAETGLEHREDSSNADLGFARNRVRRELLPAIENAAGPAAIENLFAFARAVQGLESALDHATAHLTWTALPHARARGAREGLRGGMLARGALMALAPALRKRAIARLLLSGTAQAPGRALLEALAADLQDGRCTRHALPGGWSLQLRSAELVLEAPRADAPVLVDGPACGLPFPSAEPDSRSPEFHLPLPGLVCLEDGRRLSAQVLRPSAPRAVPRSECEVELDLASIENPRELRVRFPRPGDRFHALGAPGSKSLARFLADRGIPRGDRPHVPLVTCGSTILWVAGVRPAEESKVHPETVQRLRIELEVGGELARASRSSAALEPS